MAANYPLKFAPDPRETALTAHRQGRIAATARYDLADPPSPGDRLHLLTPDGDEFAVGTVENVIDTAVDRVLFHVGRDSVLYGHDDTAALASALDGYYDHDGRIGATSPVTLIYYTVDDWEGVP